MVFNLQYFACGNISCDAPALHQYKTADTVATVNTAGYFNPVIRQLRVGDLVHCFADTGGTPQGYFLTVNGNDGTTVDVTDGLAIGTTDTD